MLGWESVVHLIIKRGDKVGKDKRLRVLLLVELGQVGSVELLLGKIGSESLEDLQVLGADKSITVDTFTLVSPQLDQMIGLLDCFGAGLKHTLHDVGQMTHIELIMEVNRCLLEISFDFSMQVERSLDHLRHELLHIGLILAEMFVQEGTEDSEE